MKKRVVIYTAITKDYDELKEPAIISNQCDYICFTDDPTLISPTWQIRPLPPSDLDIVRQCRQVKIMPHFFLPEYEYSIWVDGNVEIIGDINQLIEQYFINGDKTLYTFKHPVRDCVYEEAKECIKNGQDNEKIIRKQLALLKSEYYPKHNGLIESNVILRKTHSPDVMQLMEQWWKLVKNYSRRDTLSFNYAAWVTGFFFGCLEGNSRGSNSYFRYLHDHIILEMEQPETV
ncbi:glycosyltransferase domain-containing protein [Niallia taxi]|uniref:glycosyltransferase domain-containing protein n=1 Tax=Niallia taxi TaxID=2499688 RepID=UPI003D2E7EA9